MRHADLILFFAQILTLLLTALVFGRFMRALKQPTVLGELVGGILLGPTLLGTIAPEFYAQLFTSSGELTVVRDAVAHLGMLFFLFVAG